MKKYTQGSMVTDRLMPIGTLVRLRSGGPLMTVKQRGSYFYNDCDLRHVCSWFDCNGKYFEKMFSGLMLVKDESKDEVAT